MLLMPAFGATILSILIMAQSALGAAVPQISVRLLRTKDDIRAFDDELWVDGEIIVIRDSEMSTGRVELAGDQKTVVLRIPKMNSQVLGTIRLPVDSYRQVPILPVTLAPTLRFGYSGGPGASSRQLMFLFSDRTSVIYTTKVIMPGLLGPKPRPGIWPELQAKALQTKSNIKDAELRALLASCYKH